MSCLKGAIQEAMKNLPTIYMYTGQDGAEHPEDSNLKDIHHLAETLQKVHDRDNNQRTIVINSNLQGTCFVTQSQAANVDNLVAQLLDQCVSVTIIQG